MNALIVLCHFCEQHGPSVVMCTQPFLQAPSKMVSTSSGTNQSISDHATVKRTTSHTGLLNTGGGGDNWTSEGGPLVFASDFSTSHTQTKSSPAASQQFSFPTPSNCRACSFTTRDESGLVSHDHAACTSYISMQWPNDPDLMNFVWTACQRSLSCEVCPGQEGAFYFGDELNGHVISYNFHVKDAQARGLQGQFSFLVVSWDRVLLINLWPFLISNLAKMASRIQQSAEQVFTGAIAASSGSSGSGTGVSSSKTRTVSASGRGATPPNLGVSGMANVTLPSGSGLRQRRAVDTDMRSLATLTNDEQIFCRIHAWFTWLLRAAARRWVTLPSLTAPPDEDILIEREEREALMVVGPEQLGLGINAGMTSMLTQPMAAVGTTTMALGKCLGLAGDSLEEETCVALLVLTRLFHTLGVRAFGRLAQHVAVGNQLVVQPLEENLLGCLTIAAVAKLLPRGCLKQVILSSEYLPPFRCNLLSLTADAVPSQSDWSPDESIQFLAVRRDGSEPGTNDSSPSVEEFVHSLQFHLCSTWPSVDPELAHLRTGSRSGKRSVGFVPPTNTGTSAPVSSYVMRVIQLLNSQPPLPPSTLDLALAAARQEWINRARLLYSFKRCQGPNLSGDETTRRWAGVLAAIDCTTPENANIARFWQGALSRHSRQNTCHSHRRPTSSTHTSRRASVSSSSIDLAATMAFTSLTD